MAIKYKNAVLSQPLEKNAQIRNLDWAGFFQISVTIYHLQIFANFAYLISFSFFLKLTNKNIQETTEINGELKCLKIFSCMFLAKDLEGYLSVKEV